MAIPIVDWPSGYSGTLMQGKHGLGLIINMDHVMHIVHFSIGRPVSGSGQGGRRPERSPWRAMQQHHEIITLYYLTSFLPALILAKCRKILDLPLHGSLIAGIFDQPLRGEMVMIFHASIEADNPRKVAEALAEILEGVATPFPPVEGGWIAMAGDDKSAIEVYQQGTDITMADDLKPGSGKPEFFGTLVERSTRESATHVALGTNLGEDEIMAIAKREDWPAKYYKRGAAQHNELLPDGAFGAIEIWIEGRTMIEVLTPSMQEEYTRFMNIRGWTGLLKHVGVLA